MAAKSTGMNIFRSERMSYLRFVIPRDLAYASIKELGPLEAVHFIDMNPLQTQSHREFSSEIHQCTELIRSMRFFQTELQTAQLQTDTVDVDAQYSIPELEAQFDELEKELKKQNDYDDQIQSTRLQLIEMQYTLTIGQKFLDSAYQNPNVALPGELDLDSTSPPPTSSSSLTLSEPLSMKYIVGVVSQSHMESFHKMIYIALRGNFYLNSEIIPEQLTDSASHNPELKTVFIIFYSGEHSEERIFRICASFNASVYMRSSDQQDRANQLKQIRERLEETDQVLQASREQKMQKLRLVKEHLQGWMCFVSREVAVFQTLNQFSADEASHCLIGFGWVPNRKIALVNDALYRAAALSQSSDVPGVATPVAPPTRKEALEAMQEREERKEAAASSSSSSSSSSAARSEHDHSLRSISIEMDPRIPPTYIRSTKFTEAVQAMVDSYGIATYQEVNPALFALFTFPFLFGIMFGDVVHGLLLAAVGAFFCINEKKFGRKMNDLMEYLYVGRYMIVCMGLMAAFCGFCYNEWVSLSVDMGSHYDCDDTTCHKSKDGTYFLGIDPVWRNSNNYLTYTNSIKMKISVIVAVVHMVLGLFLQMFNHIHRGNWIDLFFKFIPELLLMLALFGYMDFLIIYKWLSDLDPATAPGLIKTMINMFLKMGQKIDEDSKLYGCQDEVQLGVVIACIICIVWLLIPKPIAEVIKHRRIRKMLAAQEEERQRRQTEGGDPHDAAIANAYNANSFSINLDSADANMPSPSASPAASSSHSHHHARPSLTQPRQAFGHSASEERDPFLNLPPDPEEEAEFSVGEMAVHQLIDVIEYVLGTVSHTASFLRLWALSLAHGELAEVFFKYLMILIPNLIPVVGSAIGAAAWIGATIAILLAMEGLSAFLHCLRLHWVEFQSKFYTAEGYLFTPFSFKVVDNAALDSLLEELPNTNTSKASSSPS